MADPREEHEEELQVADLSSSDVVTKYRTAAEIVNKTLQGVIAQCVNGADVYTICQFASTVIDGQCAGMFKSKKIAKGVAFPPAISVNNTVCHFSPLKEESIALKAGDMIKIDLGAHIDGFIATAAHSVVVPAEDGSVANITGPAADVVVAAYNAAQIAARLIKPGAKNTDVTKAIERVAEAYEVEPMSGTLSHNLKQFVIDGAKVIAQKDEKEARVAEEEFEVNEVYGVDICFTTGEGKPRDTGVRTTIYKRAVETQYMLKMKSSRYVLSEVNKRFPTMPFNIGVLEDQKQARVGIVECLKHELLHPYQVLSEVEGAHVAHFKFTVLLMETGNTIITGAELPAYFKSDKSLPADLATIAKSSLKKNNRRKKKKAAAAGGGASA